MPPSPAALIFPLTVLVIQGYIVYALNMMKTALDEIVREQAESTLAEPYRKFGKGMGILANLALVGFLISFVTSAVSVVALNR